MISRRVLQLVELTWVLQLGHMRFDENQTAPVIIQPSFPYSFSQEGVSGDTDVLFVFVVLTLLTGTATTSVVSLTSLVSISGTGMIDVTLCHFMV